MSIRGGQTNTKSMVTISAPCQGPMFTIHSRPVSILPKTNSPRMSVIVEEGGTFISNYICLVPARDLQMYPVATLKGKGAIATFNSVLLARAGSLMDVGSRIILQGEGCRGEVISRAVSTGGTIIARGPLGGEHPGSKAPLEGKGR